MEFVTERNVDILILQNIAFFILAGDGNHWVVLVVETDFEIAAFRDFIHVVRHLDFVASGVVISSLISIVFQSRNRHRVTETQSQVAGLNFFTFSSLEIEGGGNCCANFGCQRENLVERVVTRNIPTHEEGF